MTVNRGQSFSDNKNLESEKVQDFQDLESKSLLDKSKSKSASGYPMYDQLQVLKLSALMNMGITISKKDTPKTDTPPAENENEADTPTYLGVSLSWELGNFYYFLIF